MIEETDYEDISKMVAITINAIKQTLGGSVTKKTLIECQQLVLKDLQQGSIPKSVKQFDNLIQ